MSELRFDIKTVSEANQREHWAVKQKRKKQQQRDFAMLWRVTKDKPELPPIGLAGKDFYPVAVVFTRYSCQALDQDNLAGAFKHVQDQLARELGIDDGDGSVKWKYEQERIGKREHYFTVRIEDK